MSNSRLAAETVTMHTGSELRQPCLHRMVADCLPDREPILDLAGRYGLLNVSIARVPELGTATPSSALFPEPLDIWKREIRELKAVADLWDGAVAGDLRGHEMLDRGLSANLAQAPFHLAALNGDGGPFRLRYRPLNLRTALWQRLAAEVAGFICCARCSAPEAARSDKHFCSAACRNRAFRRKSAWGV